MKVGNFLKKTMLITLGYLVVLNAGFGMLNSLGVTSSPGAPQPALALTGAEIDKLADKACPADQFPPKALEACKDGFKMGASGKANDCNKKYQPPINGNCSTAYRQGEDAKANDDPDPTPAQVKTKAEKACEAVGPAVRAACVDGYDGGFAGKDKDTNDVCGQYKSGGSNAQRYNACGTGYDLGRRAPGSKARVEQAKTETEARQPYATEKRAACGEITNEQARRACETGFEGRVDDRSKTNTCKKYNVPANKEACEKGFDAAETAVSGGGGSDDDACASSDSAGAFAWALCPAISVLSNTVKTIQDQLIIPALKVSPLDPNDGYGKALYTIWENIRNVANAAFVLIFLVIIFANTLSLNINAYTIKKMLPRLVAAAILVQFSFVLTAIAIDIGNILGAGVAGLIDFSVSGTDGGGDGTDFGDVAQGIVALGATAGIIALVGVPTIAFLLFSGLLSIISTMLVLQARLLIIGMCIITGPLALAAWVLPGTEKFFRLWWTTLIRVILMYPLIVILLKLSTLLSGVSAASGQFGVIMAAIFPIIALFMVSMTWSWGGKAMGMAGGKIDQITNKTGKNAAGKVGNSRPVKAFSQARNERRDLKLGNAMGATGRFSKAKRWYAAGMLTGAPFGGRLDPRGGFGKPTTEAQQLADQAQVKQWGVAQKSMEGLSTSALEGRLRGGNTTQAAAAAAKLAESGQLKATHLAALQQTFKGREAEGARALKFAQGQIKDKASNPVMARAQLDQFDAATGNMRVDGATRDKILQATTPKALGGLNKGGLDALRTTTIKDPSDPTGKKDLMFTDKQGVTRAKTMLDEIQKDTLKTALSEKKITTGMDPTVLAALQAELKSR